MNVFIIGATSRIGRRERNLPDDEEFYFAAKKRAEVALVRTDLDWLILRLSLLTDHVGSGCVALGPAELHEHISRHDVAATVAPLLHEPRIGRDSTLNRSLPGSLRSRDVVVPDRSE